MRAIGLVDGGRRLVSGGFDSAILVWDLERGTVAQVLRHHDSTVNAVQALADGCFASAGEDGRIAIWCGGKPEPVTVLTGHTAPIAALAATRDGRTLVSAGWDRTVRVWRPFEPTPSTHTIDGHKGPVNGVALTPDGAAIVTAGYDGQIRLADLATGAILQSRTVETPLNAVIIAPDGDIIAAGADGRVLTFRPDLTMRYELALDRGPLTTLAISRDGLRIAAAGLRTPVTLIDRARNVVAAEIVGPGLPVWSLTFTADGTELISGGVDRAIRRWDAATGKVRGTDVAVASETAAVADTDPGSRLFRACKACHGLNAADTHLAGPTLAGIFGRRIGTAPGYAYSQALTRMDIVWQADTLARLFEVGPNAYLPGTKMPEQRITNPDDRRVLFEWLAKVTQ